MFSFISHHDRQSTASNSYTTTANSDFVFLPLLVLLFFIAFVFLITAGDDKIPRPRAICFLFVAMMRHPPRGLTFLRLREPQNSFLLSTLSIGALPCQSVLTISPAVLVFVNIRQRIKNKKVTIHCSRSRAKQCLLPAENTKFLGRIGEKRDICAHALE